MSPVSDAHAWPPQSTPEQQALDYARVARAHLGLLVQQLKGDDNQPWRGRFLDAIGSLDRFTDLLEQHGVEVVSPPSPQVPVPLRREVPEPAPAASGPRHRVGEQTNPNLRRLRGNSAWWPR